MNEQLLQIVEASIKLKLNVANLYKIFSTAFPEDSDFWMELSLEEEHHASLIKTSRDVLLSCNEFPSELLSSSLKDLIEANNKLISLLKEYIDKPPSRESAFNVAISLEESTGELHFQRTISKQSSSEYIKIFQRLTKNDKDHAIRIRLYVKDHGIQFLKNNSEAKS